MSNLESNTGAAQAKYYSVVIKNNTHGVHDDCAICHQDHKPNVGPELFLEGTDRAVCYQCGLKYAPKMVAALEAAWRYEGKTPRRFRQFDGFANWHGDMLDKAGDGYVVTMGETEELMSGADVRVLIPFETTQADAAALLEKILRSIAQGCKARLRDETPF